MQINDQVEDLLVKPHHNTLKGQVEDLLVKPKHEMLTAEGCMVENHQIPKNKYQEALLYFPVFDN